MEHRNTRDPLSALEQGIDPPASLEARVRHTLVARGLLRPRRAANWRWLGAAAAAVVFFTAGYLAGQTRSPGSHAGEDMPRYALFLYEDASFDTSRPEAELVAEYSDWAAGLASRGLLAAGEKLAADGFLLDSSSDSAAVGGQATSRELGVLSGFFIIRAPSEAEALRIARTCPHLGYGGRIDVRPIEET